MKILDIVERESSNAAILLHREGIFWRAYEQSAYRFVNHIKPYNIKSKYYKNIKQDIVYIGFPSSYMDTIADICSTNGYKINRNTESLIKIGCATDLTGYERWKQEQIDAVSELITASNRLSNKNDILAEIAAYPLTTKTPMEAQQFLYNIQQKIV